jgi:glyoxylase-like metal-dependent hydrolase (beta-lactamase superfamily II)
VSTGGAGACDRLIGLTLGHEWQPRRISLEGGGDELVRLPVIAVLAHGPVGWTLLDTGFAPSIRDRDRSRLVFRTRAPELPGPGDPLVEALAACGLTTDDLALVAISHLHVDHTGGLAHVADGRPVAIQRRELAFGLDRATPDVGYLRDEYALPGLAWRPLDGDAEIAPGIDAVSTPGHTPGHMSFRVRMVDGTVWLFAMDAIDLRAGLDGDTPIGSAADPADDALRRRSHDRLVALAAAEGAQLVPGHCPDSWPAVPGPPVGLRARAPALASGAPGPAGPGRSAPPSAPSLPPRTPETTP